MTNSWWGSRFKKALRKRVVVHLVEGYSLDGVLHGLYADGVELGAATFVRAEDYDVPLDGVQIIPWKSIVWIQELSDAELRSGPPNA